MDKQRYPHDREIDIQMLLVYRKLKHFKLINIIQNRIISIAQHIINLFNDKLIVKCMRKLVRIFHTPVVPIANTCSTTVGPIIGTTIVRISGVIGMTVVRIASAFAPTILLPVRLLE